MQNKVKIAKIFLAFSFTVGNYLALSIVHRYIILPLLLKLSYSGYFGLVSQTVLYIMIISASITNGAIASNKVNYLGFTIMIRSILMSLVNVLIFTTLCLINPYIAENIIIHIRIFLIVFLSIFIWATTYMSIKLFNRIKTESKFIAFISTNPVVYLVISIVLVIIVVSIIRLIG